MTRSARPGAALTPPHAQLRRKKARSCGVKKHMNNDRPHDRVPIPHPRTDLPAKHCQPSSHSVQGGNTTLHLFPRTPVCAEAPIGCSRLHAHAVCPGACHLHQRFGLPNPPCPHAQQDTRWSPLERARAAAGPRQACQAVKEHVRAAAGASGLVGFAAHAAVVEVVPVGGGAQDVAAFREGNRPWRVCTMCTRMFACVHVCVCVGGMRASRGADVEQCCGGDPAACTARPPPGASAWAVPRPHERAAAA